MEMVECQSEEGVPRDQVLTVWSLSLEQPVLKRQVSHCFESVPALL